MSWAQREPCPPPAYDSLFKRNVYSFVEEQPEYSAGMAALMKYVLQNFTIPATAKERGIEGSACVTFIVEADGTIKDVIPCRRNSYYMDEAIAKVIKGMSGWKPGKCNGEPVAVRFRLPISCIKFN